MLAGNGVCWNMKTKKNKRIKISASVYNKIMSKIIAKGSPVADTLIELIEEAAKYHIISDKTKKKTKRNVN